MSFLDNDPATGVTFRQETPGAPRSVPDLIARRQFIDWMTTHHRSPVRMICGGAGYGKTSALLGWLRERDQGDARAIWITLDSGLEDRIAFWSLAIHQLSRAGIRIDPALQLTLLNAAARVSDLPVLLVRQFEAAGDLTLIIENGDLAAGSEIITDLIRLLDHVGSFTVIFTTRTTPGTTQIEQRLGHLVAVCPPELMRFDSEEIQQLAEAGGFAVLPDHARALCTLTEGWALAVRAELAALRTDDVSALHEPGMATRALGTVLLARFREHRAFAQLRRRSLGVWISARDIDESLSSLLNGLAEVGLGWWEHAPYRRFRLQPVLRAILREEIEQAEPDVARNEYLALAELHIVREEYAAAFDAALRAEAWPMAIRVYRRHLLTLTSRPVASVLSVRRVPAEAQRKHPQLAFAVALDDFAHGRRARAVRGLSYMLRRIERDHLTGRHVSVEDVWTQAIITMSHRLLGRHQTAGASLRRVHRMLERVEDPHGELDPAMSLFLSHGALISLLGDDPQYASRLLSESGVHATLQSSTIEQSRLHGVRALAEMLRGNVDQARGLLDTRAALALPASIDTSYTALPAMLASARLHLEDADAVGAERVLANTRLHAPTTDLWPLLIPVIVQVRWHLHGAESALTQLDDELAARSGRFSEDSLALVPLTALRAHLLLSQGRIETARQILSDSPRRNSNRFRLVRTRLELAEGGLQRAAGLAAVGLRSAQGPRERQTFAIVGSATARRLGEKARAESLAALAVRTANEHGVRLPLTSVPRTDIDELLHMYPDLLSQLDHFSTFPPSSGPSARLTPREKVVLRSIVDHGTVAAISAHLSVSENTVKSQLRSLYRKLGVGDRTAAVDAARRRGLF